MVQLRSKLYVHKDLRCNGKRYPKGSVLPWRDEGLRTERVLLLMKTLYLGEEQWPGHVGRNPAEPEHLDIETGAEVAARHEQEREEREARQSLLDERTRELLGEGRSKQDAASQAAGELAAMSNDAQLVDDDESERAERARRQQADREKLDAAEAQRKADEQAKLAAEAKEQEDEADVQAEAELAAQAEADAVEADEEPKKE